MIVISSGTIKQANEVLLKIENIFMKQSSILRQEILVSKIGLNDAIVVLDEAQNTTTHQIKMFLTRLGMGSKMVVTGDTTQIDLPRTTSSGLIQALKVLNGVKGIGKVEFGKKDIVRHQLVQRIVEAYEKHDALLKAGLDDDSTN